MNSMTLTPIKKVMACMMTLEQIQQMFSEDSDEEEFVVLNQYC